MNQEVIRTIAERRSVRKFTKERITNGQIAELIYAALYAPTARNAQSNEVFFVRNEALVKRIQDESDAYLRKTRPGMSEAFRCYYDAPVICVLAADPESPWKGVDCGIIAENISLACCAIGLGSCMIGMVKDFMRSGESAALREAIGTGDLEFQLAIAIGVPGENPAAKPRDKEKMHVVD